MHNNCYYFQSLYNNNIQFDVKINQQILEPFFKFNLRGSDPYREIGSATYVDDCKLRN